ncbi:transporter, major facilitator family protein [Ancylostoma caninum]|uniref:Transporter, major facilitator family protein n=1 Tax=Ancylostoma caninum TaxID=29170 RepID=A0A368F725_ANCCA|nr:transporter, major facilitator family protein [Ancylostoma caninum]
MVHGSKSSQLGSHSPVSGRKYIASSLEEDDESKGMLEKSDETTANGILSMDTSDDVKTARLPHFPLFSPRSMRIWICMLLTTGLYATVSMRLNLSMAVVCMVNSTAFLSETSLLNETLKPTRPPKCEPVNTDQDMAIHAGYTGDLLWSPAMLSLLFSATFYGGLATIAFAGVMADRYGPKTILIVVTLDYIIVTLLSPLLARWSYYAYFVSRLIMGVGEGFVFPCLASIVGKWFTPAEKSTVAAMYTSGNQLAAGFTSLISSYLCTLSPGWPIIFYIFGGVGCLWLVLWVVFASDSPSKNKFVSEEEKAYLAEHIHHGKTKAKLPIPWKSMLTSRPLIAAVLCQYTYNLQASLLQSFLPTFLKEELMLPLSENGLYTMIPFIAQLISKNILGILADHLKRNGVLSHTKCAKVFQSIGSFGSAAMMIALATLPSCENPYIALPLLGLYGTFFSAGICGFFTCVLCIAPAFSGTITSLSMIFGMFGNISGPMMLGIIAKMGFNNNKWVVSFMACSGFNVIAGVVFIIFGSAKVQEWAKVQPPKSSSA